MSKTFNDPSLLTKDRLKKELESSGVKLPRGDQKKEFYVRLYRENLSPQSGQSTAGRGEFSSDDDDFDQSPQTKQIVPRGSRSIRKAASKEIVSADIKSMTDEDLKEELATLGSPVGPIMPSTRGLYERKLARMRDTLPSNGTTVTTITKSEFSDDNEYDEEEVQDEESAPDDEFFYKRQSRNRRSGANFGPTFTKNFHDTSSQKEVTRDFSVSSSRNVERSSTFDRQTMNKVRTKKGDKFEEKNWSTSTSNDGQNGDEEDGGDDVLQLPGLPSNIQQALTAARFSPEISPPASEVRARPSAQQQKAEIPEDIPRRKTNEEKPTKSKQKTTKTWRWVLLIVVLILIIFAAAVVYNIEKLPEFNKHVRAALAGKEETNMKQNST